jgi:D-3-phosphoglycerate dehydrogenase
VMLKTDSPMNIGILESGNYSTAALRTYGSLGPVFLLEMNPEARDNIVVLVVRLGHSLDAAFLSKFPKLRIIVTPTTGTDHIDHSYCSREKIEVISLKAIGRALDTVSSTAEHTLGLILAITRQTVRSGMSVALDSRWERDRFRGRQLSNLTLGIVGFGRIGSMLFNFARPIFKEVVACDVDSSRFSPSTRTIQKSLEQLLSASDVIAITASALDKAPAIGTKELSQMRDGVYLVNSARSSLIDEEAVVKFWNAGKIGGYATDVLSGEPFGPAGPGQHPLRLLASERHNIIITPHIGGCTDEAMAFTEDRMAEAVVDILHGSST